MNKILYIKYGELYLKGCNKNKFIKQMYKNIVWALNSFKFKIEKKFDCIYITDVKNEDEKQIVNILKFVPGIKWIIYAWKIEKNIDSVFKKILDNFNFRKSLKINVKRIDKNFEFRSRDVIINLGKKLADKFGKKLKINVSNPEQIINIEIKIFEIIFYYSYQKIEGIGGLPVGMSGNVLVLLSGGIDSPVAACLIQKKGMIPHFITYIIPPYTSVLLIDKIKKLVNKITLNAKISSGKLFIVDFSLIFNEIQHLSNPSYKIIIIKRIFLKIASEICKFFKFDSIITGDSLGQVASQTSESIAITSEIVKDFVIHRPLICFDKFEIINLSKFYETYDISTLSVDDTCLISVPKKPVIKPKLSVTLKIEEELKFLEPLINQSVKKIIKGVNNE